MTDRRDDVIIDSTIWLIQRIEGLIAADRLDDSRGYLEKLLVTSDRPFHRIFALKHLGIIALKAGDENQAKTYLESVAQLEVSEPEAKYLLGDAAATLGSWWLALLNFMEAFADANDGDENRPKYMHAAANAFVELKFGEVALAVLLGAKERRPDDPFIISALESFYEREERFLDAIEMGESLAELARSEPGVDEIDVKNRLRRLSEKMRNRIQLADEISFVAPDQMLSPTKFPSGFNTLVSALGTMDRNQPLLKSASVLWARVAHSKLDEQISAQALAAAIHWVVERLHWRLPTSLNELERLYGVDHGQLEAVVRLIVASFEVAFVPSDAARSALTDEQVQRLQKVQKALLFGVDLDDVEIRTMLE